jgi:hypothetical protein
MRRNGQNIQLSASDVVGHLACKHLTQLDRAVAEGRTQAPPPYFDPVVELLQRRGLEHEIAYVEHLRAERGASNVMEIREYSGADAAERTLAAMRAGADVIVQGVFQDVRWYGRADILLRVETPSDLGDWSYEVIDTKLARDTKGRIGCMSSNQEMASPRMCTDTLSTLRTSDWLERGWRRYSPVHRMMAPTRFPSRTAMCAGGGGNARSDAGTTII